MSRSALTTVLNPKGWLIQTVDGLSGGSADVSCLTKRTLDTLEGEDTCTSSTPASGRRLQGRPFCCLLVTRSGLQGEGDLFRRGSHGQAERWQSSQLFC